MNLLCKLAHFKETKECPKFKKNRRNKCIQPLINKRVNENT